jgi:thermitase
MKTKHLWIGSLFLAALMLQANSQQFRARRRPILRWEPRPQSVQAVDFKANSVRGGPEYATEHILVKFKPTVSQQGITHTLRSYGSRSHRKIPAVGLFRVDIPEGSTVEEMLYVWNQNALVEHARPDHVAHIAVTPNDKYFNEQYALANTGQAIPVPGSPTGKASADISATSAWEETKGDENIIIAVIDTGVDFDHPDLKNKIIPSGGWDFVNDDSDATDDNGHGTFVAGIAAAETNNSEGIAGVAWNCKLMPVKTMAADGDGFYSDVIAGIIWAYENGADVINLSLGGDYPDPDLEQALLLAFQAGVVVVAASGNDDGAGVLYPAKYDQYVLAVAATDYNDERPVWSNYGPEVDVAAPGDAIISTVPTWYFGPGSLAYGMGDGTSFSSPFVAGMAALIKSEKPWLTQVDIMKIIRYTADDVNAAEYPGMDDFIGYGRINMATALVPIQIKK